MQDSSQFRFSVHKSTKHVHYHCIAVCSIINSCFPPVELRSIWDLIQQSNSSCEINLSSLLPSIMIPCSAMEALQSSLERLTDSILEMSGSSLYDLGHVSDSSLQYLV